MTGYFPLIIIAILIALYFFYEMNRVAKNKRINSREDRRSHHEERLKALLKKTKSNNEAPNDPKDETMK